MDLQYGQRENLSTVSRIMILGVGLRRAVCAAAGVLSNGRQGAMRLGAVASAAGSTAGFPGCRYLFWCSQVGLRQLHPFLRARNLALVPLE
jgi:hypothetical protein